MNGECVCRSAERILMKLVIYMVRDDDIERYASCKRELISAMLNFYLN